MIAPADLTKLAEPRCREIGEDRCASLRAREDWARFAGTTRGTVVTWHEEIDERLAAWLNTLPGTIELRSLPPGETPAGEGWKCIAAGASLDGSRWWLWERVRPCS